MNIRASGLVATACAAALTACAQGDDGTMLPDAAELADDRAPSDALFDVVPRGVDSRLERDAAVMDSRGAPPDAPVTSADAVASMPDAVAPPPDAMTCATGLTLCNGACVDTATDPAHCGGCATACPAGATCAAGACQCPAGLDLCGSACVDTTTSRTNCGACGHGCAGTTVCCCGACTLPRLCI